MCIFHISTEGFKVPCADTSSECLKRSLQEVYPQFIHGIPELGLTSLDPFEVDSLVLKLPGELTLELKDAYAKGLQKCNVDYIRYVRNMFYIVIVSYIQIFTFTNVYK